MFDSIKRKKIDIKEGTIEFWTDEDKLIWNDNKKNLLFNVSVDTKGSIFLIKDNDNKLKFFHVLIGKGRTDVEIDVSALSNEKPHHIVAIWSLNKRKIVLFIDGGNLKKETPIIYPVNEDYRKEPKHILNFLTR